MRIEPEALGHKGFGTLTRAACGGLPSPAYDAGEGVRKRLARFPHKLSGQACAPTAEGRGKQARGW